MAKTTQKCPEGNTRTSGRLFCYTAFSDDAPAVDADYHCYGRETCPSTGRAHWQGFCYFKNKKTLGAVIKLLKPHHVELCRGSLADNEKYCAKSGDYTEIGTRPAQGTRTDLNELANRVAQGTSVDEIVLENPIAFHQYGRTLERLEDIRLRKIQRTEMPKCIWIYGPTGVGKSHKAAELAGADVYRYPHDNGWWDGYCGQNAVIFDDFRGEVPYGRMLTLCDKWPTTVRRRNKAPFPFTAKIIIVTAFGAPNEVYHNLAATDSMSQIERRFEMIHLQDGP